VVNIFILLTSIIAGICTYIISNKLNKGAVFASATVTLVSGIIFPHFFPELGSTLMLVAACASYAGMISVNNAPSIRDMIIISAITGLLFVVSSTAYVGIGGRLGTIAAISCLTWTGAKKLFFIDKLPQNITKPRCSGV
jgi:hypothetical protein